MWTLQGPIVPCIANKNLDLLMNAGFCNLPSWRWALRLGRATDLEV